MTPSVLIAVPCRETAPSTAFYDCLQKLETVPGTTWYQSRTGVIPGARNRICREALRLGVQYVWMLDDDQLFAPDALKRLLARRVDAVIGLVLNRKAPFAPLIYDRLDSDGRAYQHFLNPHEGGLLKIAAAGCGGLLLSRKVLEALSDPWFTFERSPASPDDYAEDLPFYGRLRDAGFSLYCDLDVKFGHTTTNIVWPVKDARGVWTTVMADDQPFMAMPAACSPLSLAAV